MYNEDDDEDGCIDAGVFEIEYFDDHWWIIQDGAIWAGPYEEKVDAVEGLVTKLVDTYSEPEL